jgi:hypothetical protein
MAHSPAHKFGQEIGKLLEEIVGPLLAQFAEKHGYYLDKKGVRGAARTGEKVTWRDEYGNRHELDFVLEKGGTPDKKGHPLAFIETAWRRYTKHARNKAQEIQGAILPIAQKHNLDAPFLGVVLAGIFTEGAITQLQTSGFTVLYIKRETIVAAFAEAGISIDFDEQTADKEFSLCLRKLNALSGAEKQTVIAKLKETNDAEIKAFMSKLEKTLTRFVESILVTPLFGRQSAFSKTADAANFLQNAKNLNASENNPLARIELFIRYNNGDTINTSFGNPDDAVEFLMEKL